MRVLIQPGPIHPHRIDSFAGNAAHIAFSVESGVSLLQGLTAPLTKAGFQAAVLTFSNAIVGPFRYVMPDHATDSRHVAYFSAPRAPIGSTRIERANATFGWHQGQPFLHTHAAWIEAGGQRRGGHILNDETILSGPIKVEAWGFKDLRVDTSEDFETNFSLFQPSGTSTPGANAILARVRPNEDIIRSIETISREHAMPDAAIKGSVGSLIGTRFADGRVVTDHATEVLIASGEIRGGVARLDLISVDMAGQVHEGRIARDENPVCITFDLVMVRIPSAANL